MSVSDKGLSCVRCRSYLFDEDDVVYCPVCGAPHHRECYNALGHCALEELHGTENQYSRKAAEEKMMEKEAEHEEEIKNTVFCQMCGEKYDSNLDRCPKCAAPNINGINGFAGFDFLGGVPADKDLGDGVTADEAKNFVMANTQRYIPKFAALNEKHKISWNWMAFLFPACWMFSRKMFKGGIIAAAITIIAKFLSYPLQLQIYNMGYTNPYDTNIVSELAERLPEIDGAIIILAFIGLLLSIFLNFFFALFGDYIYKNHSIKTIKKIKTESEDSAADYRKKGGMSFTWFLLSYLIIDCVLSILMMFL